MGMDNVGKINYLKQRYNKMIGNNENAAITEADLNDNALRHLSLISGVTYNKLKSYLLEIDDKEMF